ncbi:MAG: hypothetical protein Q7W30_00090 [Coriobacteriia bacterium]|nr:hypothetical protein [Coriobacteriia bacterium]
MSPSDQTGFAPIRGKCTYWRESLNDEDRWDTSVKREDRRIACTCFVEGDQWQFTVSTTPSDCPRRYHCRYYVKSS